MSDDELRQRIEALETRQRALEKIVQSAFARSRGEALTEEEVLGILRQLGSRIVEQQPNGNYFNERFRDYELALLNVKNMGYYIGRELYDQNRPLAILNPVPVRLGSKLCTQRDMDSEWLAFWCAQIKVAVCYHRKLWELCFIAQALYSDGKLQPGSRGLGFGCGNEALPALFAKYGATVLATDLDPTRPEAEAWMKSNQHADTIAALRRHDICPDENLSAGIDLRNADMNAIPSDLDHQFDFCWSACALEHLGSIAKGLDFIENSLRTLKPGGIAVHTTEFNLHDGDTIDNWPTVLYQKHHFVEFAERLRAKGHQVSELNFDPGQDVMDGFVDIPRAVAPWKISGPPAAHLKLSVDGFACTSFGIIIRAA